MIKILKSIASFCVLTVILTTLCACSNKNDTTKPNENYYAKLGYYKVTFCDNLTFDANSNQYVVLDDGSVMFKPYSTITPLIKTQGTQNVSLGFDVQRETINYENQTILSGVKINDDVYTFDEIKNGFIINDNLNISLYFSHFEIAGVSLNLHYTDENAKTSQSASCANLDTQKCLSRVNGTVKSNNELLMFVLCEGGLRHSNSNKYHANTTYKVSSKTEDLFDITIEIFPEIKEACSYFVIEDELGEFYLIFNKHTANLNERLTFDILNSYDFSPEIIVNFTTNLISTNY